MCGNKEYFSDIDESYRDSVKLGNNSSTAVIGKGNVRLNMNGNTYTVTRVFFVPELRNNILSIEQLQEKGLAFCFNMESAKCFILKTV